MSYADRQKQLEYDREKARLRHLKNWEYILKKKRENYWLNRDERLRRGKEYYQKHKESVLKSAEKSRKKYPEKYRAHYLMNSAIQSGKIKRLPCRICGGTSQGHHADYSKPLVIDWLCKKHHAEEHRKINDKGKGKRFKKALSSRQEDYWLKK